MKTAAVMNLLLIVLICAAGGFAAEAGAQMGINLSGPADWNTELPFADVFRMSRRWISQQEGKPWGQGPNLKLDARGWVTSLEPGCWAETVFNTIETGRYPAGDYTVLYRGKGIIDAGGAEITERGTGRLILKTSDKRGSIFLRIRQTDPNDYIRDIRVIMPGFENRYEENPWHPVFLDRWKEMSVLRFMDFMHTNNSEVVRWSDRPVPTDATFSAKGVPLEYMLDLANRLKADPWFCMPHKADDEYVRRFAEMVREGLAPGLKVYVEYSNEVWNGIFGQHRYAQQQGLERGLGHAERPWEAAWQYTAVRSVEIFKIWEEVFGGTGRLVRVLPGFAANAYVSEQVTAFKEAYKHADALAIAPYISFNIAPTGELSAQTVQTWTVEQVLDELHTHRLPECIEWMKKNKAVADKHGLKLIAYEAGQHMVGVGGGENNEALTALLHQANAHERLGAIYDDYYQAWQGLGGGLICHFSSVGQWSKWGSWGLIEYYDSEPTAKYESTFRWARRFRQNVNN
jgi:hypothetical protein